MEKRTDSPYPRRDRPILAILGVVLVVATVLFLRSAFTGEWRYYQWEFRRMVGERFGEERAAGVPAGLQQIYVRDLDAADRCQTCHQAITWKGFEEADHPYRTHPPEPLVSHPIERFGCVSCHGGQGWAVSADAAHGYVEFWETPVLGASLGEEYSLALDRSALMEMNCNGCHRFDRETAGAEATNLAKSLVAEKGCRACHVINGRGGTIGPDLTFVGDKSAEQYDHSRLLGQKTAFAWHVAHFKDPRSLVPDSVMPNFNLTSKQAQALSVLAMSWREVDLPASYMPGSPKADLQSEEERIAEERMQTGPGAWFVKTGCFVCHSLQVFGVKSPAQIGPDLSNAVEDVQARFGRTLDDFLREPTGTMAVVLSRQIILTPEEKAIAVAKLREAFAEYQRQRAAGASAAPRPL